MLGAHALPGTGLAAVALALGALILPVYADDQSVPQTPTHQHTDDDQLPEIVVTGSHIARPDDERLEPTIILTSEFLDLRGYTNVIDALNELPIFGEPANSLIGSQTSEGVGQSYADLFSLGAHRTLTLVDGLRFVSSASPSINGPLGGVGEQVDLNVIPTALIDRIEIISIGGAPIYGSDAIAGTINIILKHDYQGVQIDAERGISGFGDSGEYRARSLVGQNFADGRGNVTLNVEFARSDGLLASQRPRTDEMLVFAPPTGPSPYQSVIYSNTRFANYAPGSLPLVADGFLAANPNFAITNNAGQDLAFSGGHLVPYNPGTFTPNYYSAVGGDGFNVATVLPILSPSERINATTLGNFQVNDDMRLSAQAWYSKTHNSTLGDLVTPDSGLYGVPAGQPFGNLIIQTNNAFLSPADQAIIAKNLAAYAAASPTTPQQTSQFYLARINTDIGNGVSTADQNTDRFVLALDGTLPELDGDVKYQISGSYGETRNTSASPQLNFNNFQNALNAIVGPGGQIICNPYRSNGKPIVNSPYATGSNTCAPFNPFGSGVASPAAYAYITSLATEESVTTQRDFIASLNGALFSLPAGAVKAAVGFENRRDSAAYAAGDFLADGSGYYGPFGPVSGAYHTNELFAEMLLPLLAPEQAVPAIHRVEIEAAVREVDHSLAGKAATWTAGLRYEPVGMLQFRGNYTHSIQAPSITDALLPPEPSFTTADDPCDQSQIKSGPNPAVRAANCAKAGITQPFNSSILYAQVPSINVGNPNLTVETADALTVGFVWRPAARLSVTADYLQIDIEHVITALDADEVLDGCYDSQSYPNAFCGKFARNSAGQITVLQTGYANLAEFQFSGVQSAFEWSFDVPGGFGEMDLRVNEFFLNRQNYNYGSGALYVDAGTIEYSKHKGVIDVDWHDHGLYALWQARFIGPAVFNNQVPVNATSISGVGAWWVNDVTLGYQVNSHLKAQLVIDNVFDKQAPYPLPETASNGYDFYAYYSGIQGRYFKLIASYKF
jgi:iron complex outermembrane receptor protein